MTETCWLFDPIGRIRNISLAPSPKNALQPLFEALMNSIQAIDERFGSDNVSSGNVEIRTTANGEGAYTGFIVKDDGIGLNQENMDSFRKLDSMKKMKVGGKGVGRLLWLKVAEKVAITSHYETGDGIETIEFDFIADPEKPPISNLVESGGNGEVGTTVRLTPLKPEYAGHIPAKLETIAVRIIAHFLNYFVNFGCPHITLSDSETRLNLHDKFNGDVARREDKSISVSADNQNHQFSLNLFLVPKKYSDAEKGNNGLFFGANGRAVTRCDMDSAIGLKTIGEGKYAAFGYLEGQILDDSVNDTRTGFSLDESFLDSLKRECVKEMQNFLKQEIDMARKKQAQTITSVRNEHLRFYNIARDPEEIARKLPISTQDSEGIFVELSRHSYRQYKKSQKRFNDAMRKQISDLEQEAKEYVGQLQNESLSSLAEYVYKRKLIIETLENSIGFTDLEKKTTDYENVIHNWICPLKSSTQDLDYNHHNLWVIDDRLAFYSYFNSDQLLSSQSRTSDRRRPDITFFDLGLGFDKGASQEPITIVEFKRPKRDDYTMSSNPFVQVQDYVEKLREAGEATSYKGQRIRVIESETPFLCQIVADDTKSLKDVMNRIGGFYRKAGSKSYYRWDDVFKTFMEVTSYADLISGAKARHEAFFERLGISF